MDLNFGVTSVGSPSWSDAKIQIQLILNRLHLSEFGTSVDGLVSDGLSVTLEWSFSIIDTVTVIAHVWCKSFLTGMCYIFQSVGCSIDHIWFPTTLTTQLWDGLLLISEFLPWSTYLSSLHSLASLVSTGNPKFTKWVSVRQSGSLVVIRNGAILYM